jgi:hypothetical protein
MGKLIDKIKVGMSMEEVRKIIPYKPFLIIADSPMNQKTGHTKWIYLNSKGTLRIFFQDSIYQSHSITPTLDEMDRQKEAGERDIVDKPEILSGGFKINLSKEKLEQIRKQFNTWN